MDVYSMCMNIVENGVLDSARDNILSATMKCFGLKLYKYQLAADKKIPQKRIESKRKVRNDEA